MAALVFLENILMIIFFAFVGHNISNAIRDIGKKDNNILKRLVYIMASLIIGFILNMSINQNASENNSWQSASFQNIEMTRDEQVIENNQVETSGQSNMMNVIMKAGSDGSFGVMQILAKMSLLIEYL